MTSGATIALGKKESDATNYGYTGRLAQCTVAALAPIFRIRLRIELHTEKVMSKLGRILVVVVFAMSCFFLAFAFMVFNTRVNWNAKAAEAEADLRAQRTVNTEIQSDIRRMEIDRAVGDATRTSALTLLEATLATSETEVAEMRQELNRLQAEKQEKGRQVTGTLATLQSEREKVNAARNAVEAAQAERDKLYEDVLKLKNEILELEAIRQRLNPSESRLLSY